MELRGEIRLFAVLKTGPDMINDVPQEVIGESIGAALDDVVFGELRKQAEPMRQEWRLNCGDTRFDELMQMMTFELDSMPPAPPQRKRK